MTEQIINSTVADWLLQHPAMPILVTDDVSVSAVAITMLDNAARDAYVCDGDAILGHLSFVKVMNHVFAHERPIHTHRQLFSRVTETDINELMDPHFQYCRPDEKLADVLHRQLESGTDDIIVLNRMNRVEGVIRLTEVLKASLQ